MNAHQIEQAVKFNPMQIENIIDKVVPIIAAPEDYEFFKGVLFIKAEESSSAEFSSFVSKLLKAHSSNQQQVS